MRTEMARHVHAALRRRGRFAQRTISATIVLAAALTAPCLAAAATTIGSSLTATPNGGTCGASTFANVALSAGTLRVPFAGVLVRWRLNLPGPGGASTYRLRMLRPAGGMSYEGAGTGPPQAAPLSGVNVISLPSPLPVQTGDIVAVDCPAGAPAPFTGAGVPGSVFAFFGSGLPDGSIASPTNEIPGDEELVNADLVGPPSVAAVSPASGPAAGGTPVTISGTHLADVTNVSFGGMRAGAATPISESQLTVMTPAHAAGSVGVQVTNAAGTSPAGTGDSFTYQAPPPTATAPLPAPNITHASQTRAVWREGHALPKISRRRRRTIGTTFSLTLNEPADVAFTFMQRVRGRRAGNKCVARVRSNSAHKACSRTVTRGLLSFTGHAGTNVVGFQGRIAGSRKLRPGRYVLAITATNSNGTSSPATLSFEIVK